MARSVSPEMVAIVDWKERLERSRFRTDSGQLRAVALSPDGTKVASCGQKGELSIWNPSTGHGQHLEFGPYTNVRFSADGQWLFGAGGESMDLIRVADWSLAHQFSGLQSSNPALLATSQDGQWLAWSHFGNRSYVLVGLGDFSHKLITGVDEIFALSFAQPKFGGTTGHSGHGAVRLWLSLVTQRPAGPYLIQSWALSKSTVGTESVPDRELPLMNQSVGLAVSPTGGSVLSGDGQGAQMWDIASGRPERRFAERETKKVAGVGSVEVPRTSLTPHVAYADEGAVVLTDGEYLRVWDTSTGDLLWTYTPA